MAESEFAEQPKPKIVKVGEEGGAPAWMATFADMMTLLLCFFVLLLSFATQDAAKFKDMLGSVQDAFGVQVKRREDAYIAFSPSKFERDGVDLKEEQRELLGLVIKIRHMLDPEPELRENASVTAQPGGAMIRYDATQMFAPGSATLLPHSKLMLDKVIEVLKEHKFDLMVRAHTDNQPTGNPSYPTNWELSASRAAAALRYILEVGGISSNRLRAVGFADSQPLLPNTTAENRVKNNRLEFYYYKPKGEMHW